MTQTPRRALWTLIGISLCFRLAWAAILPPGHDEAYYYLYATHPDWSYFDHPPMLMLLEQFGLHLGGGVSTLSLRLGFVLLFAGSTWILFRWAARWYGDWAGFYAALALNLSAYFTAAAGAFALPDGPLLFFALLTLWRLSEALSQPAERLRPWLWVGLAWAGALLSKYHAVFVAAGAFVYVLTTPQARRCLRRPGPYLAAAIGACGFLPVLIWNLENDWASFAFQAGRAVGWRFRFDYLAVVLTGPMLFLFPWMWLALVRVFYRWLRRPRSLGFIERFCLCQSLVPLVFFLIVGCVRLPLPHWPLIGFLALYPALGAHWAAAVCAVPAKMRRRLVIQGAAVVVVTLAVALHALFSAVKLQRDPIELSDWSPIARELEVRGLVGQPGTFLFTRSWFKSGHLAFALRESVPVLCYDGDARGFAYWSRPEDWLGQDGIFVSLNDSRDPANLAPYFRRMDLIAEFPTPPSVHATGSVRVFRCVEQIAPYPFRRH